jgi:hypothetical protein
MVPDGDDIDNAAGSAPKFGAGPGSNDLKLFDSLKCDVDGCARPPACSPKNLL